MTERIGIAIAGSRASIVLLRGDVIAWSSDIALGIDTERLVALQELFARLPKPTRRRATLGVTLGKPWSQVRRLEGLPALTDPMLTQIVRQNAATFFLKRPSGVSTSAIARDGEGVVAAAFDRDVIEEIVAMARAERLRLIGVVAGGSAGGAGLQDACSAARIDRHTPLVWTDNSDAARRRLLFRRMAVASLVVAGIAAWVAPLGRALIDERRMTRELADAQTIENEALRISAEMQRTTSALDRRLAFETGRGRVVRLLAVTARALPDSTALLSFRADSTEANIVIVSRSVAAVVPALSAVDGVSSVRLVGAVAHDAMNGAQLQRAALRVRLAELGGR